MKFFILGLLLSSTFAHDQLITQRDEIFSQYDKDNNEILSKE